HRLADHPGLGHLREDLADEALRVWTVHSYLVIYRPDARPLQIVRVLSGYRDIAILFEWPPAGEQRPAPTSTALRRAGPTTLMRSA
ncbi:MAG: type II toxin-antitoxin system RelE/ParE family toxin, partial [Nitriliruptoraceae bacterium]